MYLTSENAMRTDAEPLFSIGGAMPNPYKISWGIKMPTNERTVSEYQDQ